MLKFTDDPVLPKQDILAAYESVCPGVNLTVGWDPELAEEGGLPLSGGAVFTTMRTPGEIIIVLDHKIFAGTHAWFQQNVLRHEMVHAREIGDYCFNEQDHRYQLGLENQAWMTDWIHREPRGFFSNYLEWSSEYYMNDLERPVVEYFQGLYGGDHLNTVQASHNVIYNFISTSASRPDVSRGWLRKAVRPIIDQLTPQCRISLQTQFQGRVKPEVLAEWGF
jgi:hypothetical protein